MTGYVLSDIFYTMHFLELSELTVAVAEYVNVAAISLSLPTKNGLVRF